MRQFAETEIIIPDGPFKGRRFSTARQPYSRLWFDLVDSGKWQRHFATGPTQSGKTLSCFCVPIMYHLFEIEETVICGIPSMDIAGDKWREDLLPAIEASRYRDLLPRRGAGSRGGGNIESVKFQNGATLKFMSGGGDDKKRAAFTSRVVVVTETDGMDVSNTGSREADPITQMEARTMSFGSRKKIYAECTVSIEQGRTWTEYNAGTATRILLRCPHCLEFVRPEREHLIGWTEAETETQARNLARYSCPQCSQPWSEQDRKTAHADAVCLHRGQELREGVVSGPDPETDTLGFRWSAVNNFFQTAGDVGAKEWKAPRSEDEENAEKELQQFYWAIPHKATLQEVTPLDSAGILARVAPMARGVIPPWTKHLAVGIDVGQYLLHWSAVAWASDATCHIVDYGVWEVPSRELGIERGLLVALHGLNQELTNRFQSREPDSYWVDAGWKQFVVCNFVKELGPHSKFRPTKGFGTTQYQAQNQKKYADPREGNRNIRYVGERDHIAWLDTERCNIVEIDVDHWKSFIHSRLSCSKDKVGAMSLFRETDQKEHFRFAKHLTAERQVSEFVQGKGLVTRWEPIRDANHWLDATTLTAPAAHLGGVRLYGETPKPVPTPEPQPVLTMPDGRPYLITER